MAKSNKLEKTNVMRLLDQANITYSTHEFCKGEKEIETDGVKVAKLIGYDPEQVFKTLVTVANTHEHFVFVLPVNHTLDLKKAAKSVNVKSIEMIKQKELFPLTGYVHGGCSPIGMKTQYKTVINETAMLFDSICFSAGKLGMQVELNSDILVEYLNKYTICKYDDICMDN